MLNCSLLILQLYYSPMRDALAAQDILKDAEKQSFFKITNLKMILKEFITGSDFDPGSLAESLKRSYYFAVKDWDVSASCFCNGQASECDANVSWGKNEHLGPVCMSYM